LPITPLRKLYHVILQCVTTNRKMINQPQLSLDQILISYPTKDVLSWIKGLDLFSFYKGGLIAYLADGDCLTLDISYSDRKDLLTKLKTLKARIRILAPDEPRIIRGVGYSPEDSNRLPRTIEGFDDIEEPKMIKIEGVRCHISIPKGCIRIVILRLPHQKDYWILTKEEFRQAKQVEKFIKENGLEKDVTYEFQTYMGYVNKEKIEYLMKN
jgi:hypothetical protein